MESVKVVNLYKMLTGFGIKIWLDGGWGVDALLGKQTRKHGDVDIVIQQCDVEKLREKLYGEGYQEKIQDDTSDWNFVLMDNKGGVVDVHVITFDSEGNGIYGPKDKGIMYPAYSFLGKGSIDGLLLDCLSAEFQVLSHTGYEIDDNDRKDVFALCTQFGVPIPKEYL